MSFPILKLVEDSIIAQNFINEVRTSLLDQFGDHKWLVEVLSEKETPEIFGTNSDDFVAKFFCSIECDCFGDGDCNPDDCNCTFVEPKIGLHVQYNTKLGELNEESIVTTVKKASTELGMEEAFSIISVKPFHKITTDVNKDSLISNSAIANLQALIGKELIEEELVKRVLFAVRDSFPLKGNSRDEISKIANAWVKSIAS